MHQCRNCQSHNTAVRSRTVVTGCGPKSENELWTCQACGFSFQVEVLQPFLPVTNENFGEYLIENFGEPKVITTEISEIK